MSGADNGIADGDVPFMGVGRIVERAPGAPVPFKKLQSTASATGMPKPMPDKRYTSRAPATATAAAAASSSQQQAPVQHTGNQGPPPALIGARGQVMMSSNSNGGGDVPGQQEQPIVTSEFLQVLRATMKRNGAELQLDPGAKETVGGGDAAEKVPIETILRVVRSSVPAQRAAGMTALKARCDAWVEEQHQQQQQRSSSAPSVKRAQPHFLRAPPDVIHALLHPDEAGPRLALLSHLAYEDPSHTVREASLLCWLSMLNSSSDDTIDTHTLAAITGAPTDLGDETGANGEEDTDSDGAADQKQDADELRRRAVKFDKCPPELDDVDVRCGPTGIKIERRYFTLEAVTRLLHEDPALGMARLGVYRTMLDRAVGRAADHDPDGSRLSTRVGGVALLESAALWRCVASAAHESSTAAGYVCEHQSFRAAFQKLLLATMGIAESPEERERTAKLKLLGAAKQDEVGESENEKEHPSSKFGHALLPCVRDALVAIHSAVHSNKDRAHRLLPVLWHPSDGGAGLFLLMKFLEEPVAAAKRPSNNSSGTTQEAGAAEAAAAATHRAEAHFGRTTAGWMAQCSALLCCILRAAVRFGVDLAEEDDAELDQTPVIIDQTKPQQQQQQQKYSDPVSAWIGDVLPFLTLHCPTGAFSVFEMLLIMNSKAPPPPLSSAAAPSKTDGGGEDDTQLTAPPAHFMKSDLKKLVDDLVFPAVEAFLVNFEKRQNASSADTSSLFTVAASTAAHLLATWISEGSLSDVFYGERDETALLARLEPLLTRSLTVVLALCAGEESSNGSGNNGGCSCVTACIVKDSLAQGLCRVVDGMARCYPKVRSRVAFKLQGCFRALLTSALSPLLVVVAENQQQQPSKELELASVTPLAFVGELLRTAHWMLLLAAPNSAAAAAASSTAAASVHEGNAAIPSLLRGDVVTCVALALVRKALRAGGGADSAVSAGLTLLLPVGDDEAPSGSAKSSFGAIRADLREELASNLLNMISGTEFASAAALGGKTKKNKKNKSKSKAKKAANGKAQDDDEEDAEKKKDSGMIPSLPRSLPVTAATNDPVFAWLLSPCLAVRKRPLKGGEQEGDNEQEEEDNDGEGEVENDPVATGNVRAMWAQWLCGVCSKVLTVSLSISAVAGASRQPMVQLLPHPLSCLAAVFLAMHCNESAYDKPPVFDEQQLGVFRYAASLFFTLCCGRDAEGGNAGENGAAPFSLLVTAATFSQQKDAVAALPSSYKYHGVCTLRKDCLETIVRCATDAVGCLDMLFVFTVATLLRGHPEHGAVLLTQLWLRRANWVESVPAALMASFPWIRRDCLSVLNSRREGAPSSPSSSSSSSSGHVKNQLAAARAGFYCAPDTTKAPRKIFTERDALDQCGNLADEITALLPSLAAGGASNENSNSNNNTRGGNNASLPLLVKAAVALMAELSAPCGDFVRTTVDELLLRHNDDDLTALTETVKELREKVAATSGATMFWLADI